MQNRQNGFDVAWTYYANVAWIYYYADLARSQPNSAG